MDQQICICGHQYDDHDCEEFCRNASGCNCFFFVKDSYRSTFLRSIFKEDLDNPSVPFECNRVTNAPCRWSNTPVMDDDCIVCLRQFASWN